MSTDIRLPRVSPDDAAVTLIKWHVAVGSRVSPGDVLAEIESDKAMVELEAEEAGVITELCVAEGSDDVHAEQILAVLDETASASEQTTSETPAAAAPVVAAPTMANDAPARQDPAARASRPIAPPLAATDPLGDASPVLLMKAVKNATELDGFRYSHVRSLPFVSMLIRACRSKTVWRTSSSSTGWRTRCGRRRPRSPR